MERLEIEFSKKAAKAYKKLPADYKELVDSVLQKLTDGLPVDIKPITGEENIYRIRVGKYRILCELIGKTLLVALIRSRGDVYKR